MAQSVTMLALCLHINAFLANFASKTIIEHILMSASLDLSGLGVALVTPFRSDKTIDYDALGKLIDFQLAGHVDYFVVLGTTAETPTLSPAERAEVARFVAKRVDGRVPLVIGCGGNSTQGVIDELTGADLTGYSAILSVVPFYNKPTQAGIYAHFAAIAAASPLPIVLYNIPGRTGVNMLPETTLRLAAEFPSIIAIKEASGNIAQIGTILRQKPESFQVISGDDSLAYPLIMLGAAGVISVVGNAYPAEFSALVHHALEGHSAQALEIHRRMVPMINLMFADGNPAGVKATLSAMGLIDNELRLPLVPVSPAIEASIREMTAKLAAE